MIWSWNLHWKYPLGSEGDWLSHQFDHVVYFGNCFWSVNYTSVFEVIFLLSFILLLLKSVFVTKFVCANLAAKFSAYNLLNSGVVIYIFHAYNQ